MKHEKKTGQPLVKRNFSFQDRMKQKIEVNVTVLKMHEIGFDPRSYHVHTMSCANNFYSCCMLKSSSVNTNCSFRHFWASLQLFLLKGLEMAFGGTALIRQFFSWYAHFMFSGGICEHRFCKKLELLYIKITSETLLRMTVLLTMKCLKQTLAHPLYWISYMPVEGKVMLVTIYVDTFLFVFNTYVIALHCCVVLLNFNTAVC